MVKTFPRKKVYWYYPTRATLGQPTFLTSPFQTWQTVYRRNIKLAWLDQVNLFWGPTLWLTRPRQLGQGETIKRMHKLCFRQSDHVRASAVGSGKEDETFFPYKHSLMSTWMEG